MPQIASRENKAAEEWNKCTFVMPKQYQNGIIAPDANLGVKIWTLGRQGMEGNNQNSDTIEDSSGSFSVNQTVILWGIAALVLAILGCTFNNSPLVLRAGFFAKFFAVVLGTGLGLAGALLGDVLRKFAHPDSVYTNGGFFQLIWIKVFWACGPQVIGLGIGVALGCAIILK